MKIRRIFSTNNPPVKAGYLLNTVFFTVPNGTSLSDLAQAANWVLKLGDLYYFCETKEHLVLTAVCKVYEVYGRSAKTEAVLQSLKGSLDWIQPLNMETGQV